MIITPLWHTEFLVDIANPVWENVRILIDSWLSEFAVGDLMERTTKVRFDTEKIKTLDAIYISHSHSDHFDPYTLVEIYQYASPLLILPFTLRYLEVVLSEFLPNTKIHWLGNRETYILKWIEITWYMWSNPEITNEDDVMMIAISNDRELLFAEIDTIPDAYDEWVQKSLYSVFTRKEYETRIYLASRNCLEGQIPLYDILPKWRKAFREKYIADQKEDILASYEKYEYEEYAHFPNLFTLSGFVRGFIGQGIAYPRSLSEDLYALSIFPLDEIVSIEHDYAKNTGYTFSQKALLAGRQYKVEGWTIEQGRKECPIGILENSQKEIGYIWSPNERMYASWPLFPREIGESGIQEAKEKILEVLNHRFLPYWSASPVASLRDTLIKNDGVYRLECKIPVMSTESPVPVVMTRHLAQDMNGQDFSLGSKWQIQKILFEYSTARTGFEEIPYEANMKIDEDYWFLDIIDFLEGRQEMYSSFWHRLDPKRAYRLWTCLGATYMNHDLNIRKYRLHFERARLWMTARDFVEGVLENLKS